MNMDRSKSIDGKVILKEPILYMKNGELGYVRWVQGINLLIVEKDGQSYVHLDSYPFLLPIRETFDSLSEQAEDTPRQ